MDKYPDQADLDRWLDDGGAVRKRNIATRELALAMRSLTEQAWAKCEATGIDMADLYAAIVFERKNGPLTDSFSLLNRAFRRVRGV